MRQDMALLKAELAKKNKERAGRSGFRPPRLFSRSRSQPVVEEAPVQMPSIKLDDLLPLLPHLSGVIPQLGNPKVADAMKMLSNPAVMSLIQQFLQGNMGGLLKQNSPTVVQTQRRRALL
ncbi:UNVERIFIED_CONTAM: hypothetical protein ABID98_004253 [Brevibacillus sp. OAP136]